MRFFQMVASSAAFIAAALAVEINTYPSGGVKAGQTYEVTYSPADNTPTTFILRKGASTDLDTIGTLTSTATGGTFSWTVASNLVDGADYALEIRQGDQTPNYSGQFGLTGGSAAASSSAAASASASSASAYSVSSVIASKASSASSAASVSSMVSSMVSSAHASATGTGSVTASHNGTVSSATLSRSATGSRATGSSTGSASIPESTGAASSLSSAPLALLLGAAGAFAFIN
ncbi:uncharacterized protein M421DRAFT_1870 [Didymella exigua CBS 183.55]|uniref:Yeast cell wall synthesis Kre9/Knh1-like N-terminal domain-containing protein n=1 Tax=Didymella exigua CBS 183.55 TaxID=1150837 RepID=A0A6A5S152_9PLEO|nr:uncharacterized protein M421DRAFT_1870 [Didymella exigua CBS 183.55]KAF1932216.1 hypothetical protein M421DRAFT_1870 [Didymella exigua CBS 183.55]